MPIILPVLRFLKIMFPNMNIDESINMPRQLKALMNAGDKLLMNIGHVSSNIIFVLCCSMVYSICENLLK